MPLSNAPGIAARSPYGAQYAFGAMPPCYDNRPPSGRLPPRSEPVFLAVYPPPGLTPRIARLAWHLRDKEGLRGMPIGQARFHVTLHHIGEYADLLSEDIDEISEAVAAIEMPPFRAALDYAMSFRHPERLPLVLRGDDGVAGLTMLQNQLVAALERIGFARPRAPEFTPHLTLLYDKQRVREQAVEEISWTVNEVVLVRSLQRQSRHLPLARWKLVA